jgi:glycosyltransferase involved in cell wall biosynthesis
MNKHIFYHENYTVGGDTTYLETLLGSYKESEYFLICSGSACLKEHLQTSGIAATSMKWFDSCGAASRLNASRGGVFNSAALGKVLGRLVAPLTAGKIDKRIKLLVDEMDISKYANVVINSGGFLGTPGSRAFMQHVGVPCTNILHNYIPDRVIRDRKLFMSVRQYVGKWIVGSPFIKKQLVDECGVDERCVCYIPYGVKPSLNPDHVDRNAVRRKVGISPDDYVVVHPSVFEKRKGHSFTIHAFHEFRKYEPRSKLLLAGSGGACMSDVRRLVKKLGMEDDVLFMGFYSPIEELIVCSDLLCLPSQCYDTTPFVVLLALACGTPVLTTRRDDFEGVLIDEENALLVPTGNHGAISEKMRRICHDDALKIKIVSGGLNAYRNVFTQDKMINLTKSALSDAD